MVRAVKNKESEYSIIANKQLAKEYSTKEVMHQGRKHIVVPVVMKVCMRVVLVKYCIWLLNWVLFLMLGMVCR
jgi:hypothetical protein